MCGIAGGLFFKTQKGNDIKKAVDIMSATMKNRGPDSYGYWDDPQSQLALGHRRLAILDLNSRSDQPMVSTCGRYVIVFNGEIYNYQQLKNELEIQGQTFKTSGDTEVILKLFYLEKEKMLDRLRGMFSIVIWDSVDKTFFMAIED